MISEANPRYNLSNNKGSKNGDKSLNSNSPFFIVIKSTANDDKSFVNRVKRNTQESKEGANTDGGQHHSNEVDCLQNNGKLGVPPDLSVNTHNNGLVNQLINQFNQQKQNQDILTAAKTHGTSLCRGVSSVQRDCKYFKCCRCGKQFPFYACLEHHISTTHEIVLKKWKCILCPYSTKKKCHLTRHIAKHLNNKYKAPTRKCEGCGKEYISRNGLWDHKKQVPKGNILRYKYCEIVYTSSNHEKLGSRLNSAALSESANTDDLTALLKKNVSQLKTADKLKNSVEPVIAKIIDVDEFPRQKHPKFKCTYGSCSFATSKKKRFVLHTYKMHINKEYKCRLANCGKYYTTENALYEHIKSCHPKRRFACKLCPMSYDYNCLLNNHMVRKHNDKSRPRFVCKLCNKQFATSSELGCHKSTHTKSKPYKCLECGRAFSRRGGLKRHMHSVHLKEKRYSCRFCGTTKIHLSQAKDHEAMCIRNKNNIALLFPDV